MAENKKGVLVTEWFSKEQIEAFINENMRPAETEAEHAIDAIIKEINEKYPKTLEYYVFPEEWENNGLAALIRENYNL